MNGELMTHELDPIQANQNLRVCRWEPFCIERLQIKSNWIFEIHLTHTYTHTHTHTHTHIHTHTETHTHTHTYIHTQKHTHTWTHTYTDRHTHTHKHANTRTQTDTHTQIHIYTQVAVNRSVVFLEKKLWLRNRSWRSKRNQMIFPYNFSSL